MIDDRRRWVMERNYFETSDRELKSISDDLIIVSKQSAVKGKYDGESDELVFFLFIARVSVASSHGRPIDFH